MKANILMVIAVALCILQGVLWAKSTASVRSHRESNDIVGHSPTEIPGIAAISLLVYAGVMISFPLTSERE